MARRRTLPRPPRRPSGRRVRPKMFTCTCCVCGDQIEVPVKPPAGVELTCTKCLSEQK